MKRFSRSRAYTNIKLVNSLIYIGLGLFIILEILRLGLRAELMSGLILGVAFVILGAVRIKAFVKEHKLR